jgi:hypothetical protein
MQPINLPSKMNRTQLIYWSLLLLAFLGCRKDLERFQPYAPSAEEIGNVLAENVPNHSAKTTFSFQHLAADQVLETPSGARVYLIDTDYLFAMANSGQPVACSTCPDLKVEVTAVFSKGDMMARGLYTVDQNGVPFESGGMIRVSASCNGEALTLLPDRTLKIQVPFTNPQSGLSVFSRNKQNQWENTNQEVFEAEWLVAGSIKEGYELLVRELGWVACGRSLPEQHSGFCVELPNGFADQNTLAYAVFTNRQVVLPLQFDFKENKFCYSNTPVGYLVQIVAVSKLGERFWLGKAQTETGTNTVFPMVTEPVSEDAMLSFLRNL